MIGQTREADIIHFMHSQYTELSIDLNKKKVVVSHAGSDYRKFNIRINKLFNPIVNLTISRGIHNLELFDWMEWSNEEKKRKIEDIKKLDEGV